MENKAMHSTLGRVLVVDDNKDVLFALSMLLEGVAEKVKLMLNPEGLDAYLYNFQPDMVLLDMNFSRDTVSGEEGFQCLQRILKQRPQTTVVMMTAYADTDKAVRAIKEGAADFVTKPWNNEKLLKTLFAARQLHHVNMRPAQPAAAPDPRTDVQSIPLLIGECEAMQRIKDMAHRTYNTDANVLLLGENGTGKDVVARYMAALSTRRQAPFVSIDMGAVSETLFESELFGHEKGAFTDAKQEKAGRVQLADGGTLFLDEIGNLSPAMQSKLLTMLERRCIVRVGGTREIPINVRLLCATNANLHQMMDAGKFRNDLYYRIKTIVVEVPPLRDRGHDIQLLADHFLSQNAAKYNKDITDISPAARRKLQSYPWPGNVRELQHCVERAVVMAKGDVLTEDEFPFSANAVPQPASPVVLNLQELERQAVETALQRAEGNTTHAAEMLGITRYALLRKMKKLQLE